MTKVEAIYHFFSGFGLTAYEENSIYDTADDIEFPYLTYELKTDSWNDGQTVNVSASIFYKSYSLVEINQKADEISQAVGNIRRVKCDGGYILISKGHPFAQTIDAGVDYIKRIVLSFNMTFATEY